MGLNKKPVKMIFGTAIFFTITITCPFLLYAHTVDKNTVRDVQLMLALKGIHKGAIDGIKGPVTRESIEEHQRRHKVAVTGEVSDQLRDELYKELFLELETNNQTNKSEGEQSNNTHEEIKRFAEELRETKDDLQNTKAALKSMNDGIAEHFVSNFRDLVAVVGAGLGIALALLGLFIGWGVPKVVAHLEGEVRQAHHKMLDESKLKILYTVYINLSHAFYRYYRTFFLEKKWDHGGLKNGISLAIWFSERAIANLKEVPDYPEKQDDLIYGKSHRAYHHASQSKIKDTKKPSDVERQDALHLVSQLKDLAHKLWENEGDRKWISCTESTAWILILLGDTPQKAEGERMIKALVQREDVKSNPLWLENIEGNYRSIGINLSGN